ncbi:Acylpyruvase FAHD1 [Blattella germanica]|nr:Acylpyruvase FAHD1 [Blattella germanica]
MYGWSLLKERNLPLPKEPVIFLKPTSSYITEGQSIEAICKQIIHLQIPQNFEVNEEVELGVIIGKKCKKIQESHALNYVGGYCLALDLTETRLMVGFKPFKEIKAKGLPWTFGKGFDTACLVSRFLTCEEIGDPNNVQIWLKINGTMKQNENTSDMVFSVESLVSYVSQYMTLEPGDLILTGSPAGVCPIVPGDVIEAGLSNVTVKFPVKSA